MRAAVSAPVARPLVDGLRNPTVAHDERIRSLVPLELTGFCAAARAALDAAARPGCATTPPAIAGQA